MLVDAEKLQRDRRSGRGRSRAERREERSRQRANSERASAALEREDAGKAVALRGHRSSSQHSALSAAEGDDVSEKMAAGRARNKQLHDRPERSDDEEQSRQLEQHIKAQHDDSDWQRSATRPVLRSSSGRRRSSHLLLLTPPRPAVPLPLAYEISEPALCLSALLHRCLGEMGGGYAKRRVEEWREALAAERAYAAACIKHHGYTERAMRYSSSIAIVELLRRATAAQQPHSLPVAPQPAAVVQVGGAGHLQRRALAAADCAARAG